MASAGLAVEIDPGGRTSEGPDYYLGFFWFFKIWFTFSSYFPYFPYFCVLVYALTGIWLIFPVRVRVHRCQSLPRTAINVDYHTCFTALAPIA